MNNIFKTIVKYTQQELYDYLVSQLKEAKYKNIKMHKNFLAARGNIPIVLVAHLDTVFPEDTRAKMELFYDEKENTFWSPDGLGADDRAGITLILYLLKNTELRPHILFTKGEELYAEGASSASRQKMFFGKISYVIELDRKSINESVFYNCNNNDFKKYINSFGFETNVGSFSDISIICPAWDVAGVNLSVGYVNEHSYKEMFFVEALKITLVKVVKMLVKCPTDTVWFYKEKRFYGSKRDKRKN